MANIKNAVKLGVFTLAVGLPTHPFWQDSCAALLNKLLSLP